MKNSRKGRNATFILTFHIIKTLGGYGGNTTLERIMLRSHLYKTSLFFSMKHLPLSHKKQSTFKKLNVNSTFEIQAQHILESSLPTKNKHKIINLNPE